MTTIERSDGGDNVMEAVFIKGGRFTVVSKDDCEARERFNDRGWYVASRAPRTHAEYVEAVRLSRLWSNVKNDKCTYAFPVGPEGDGIQGSSNSVSTTP